MVDITFISVKYNVSLAVVCVVKKILGGRPTLRYSFTCSDAKAIGTNNGSVLY